MGNRAFVTLKYYTNRLVVSCKVRIQHLNAIHVTLRTVVRTSYFCFPQNLAIAEKSGFGFGGINMFSFFSIIIFLIKCNYYYIFFLIRIVTWLHFG